MFLVSRCVLLWVLLVGDYRVADGVFVGAAVIPHGDFAYDPDLLGPGTPENIAAKAVASAAGKAGAWLDRVVQPDLLLISTPHGIALSDDFAFYLGSKARGYAVLGGDLNNNNNNNNSNTYRIDLDEIDLHPDATKDLVSRFLQDQRVSGILSFADSEDMALRWGEVIPLLLMRQATRDNHAHCRRRRHMILSHPLRRFTEAPSMIPELLRLGSSIRSWMESRPERIAVLISSDLSHTHLADGPYGYSPTSALFDAAVGRWAQDPLSNKQDLLETATSLQNDAKACGFTGLVTLHGILSTYNKHDHFQSTLWANHNATYYGMMVATFETRRNNRQSSLESSGPTKLMSE